MKKLNVFRLGLLFAGCFLGAGYVSGQELRQYFVVYGAKGYLGLLAAVAILYIFGVLCLRMAQRTGLTGADELVVPWRAPWLHRALVIALESHFLSHLVTIMCACRAVEQIFAIPHWLGSPRSRHWCWPALAGLQSVVSAFSVSVPLLVLATSAFGAAVVRNGGPRSARRRDGRKRLLGGWFPSAVNYARYNILSTIVILGRSAHTSASGRRSMPPSAPARCFWSAR